MRGARPLTDEEIELVLSSFTGRFQLRDRALFLTGLRTGFRISELLSLRVGDVVRGGKIVDSATVPRRNMKKKLEGRTVVLHAQAKEALALWVADMHEMWVVRPDTFVFLSRKGYRKNRPLGRKSAWAILDRTYRENQLAGTLGTHAMRKSFAKRVHELLGRDIVKTQQALGHRNIGSTVSYLSFLQEEIDDAILGQ